MEPVVTMRICHCTYTFTPNPVSTENVLHVTEKQAYNGLLAGLTMGAWSSSTENT